MNRAILTLAAASGAVVVAPTAFAQTADWSGLNVGVTAGYTQLSDSQETVAFDTDRDGMFNDTVRTLAGADAFSPSFCGGGAQARAPAEGCRTGDNNVNFSIRGGYDWQFGQWVVGALGEYTVVNIGDEVTAFSTTPASYTFTRDLTDMVALRGKLGYAWGSSLLYATGGYARADIEHKFTTTNTANSFTSLGGEDVDGYQLGAGYEVMLDPAMMGPGWSVGVEYLWTSLDDGDNKVLVGPGTAGPTNAFLLVDPTGTEMRRTGDTFEISSVGLTLSWRQ